MKNEPLVSIVVAAYNDAKYLGECLSSVLSQTYDNLEIVVVNDGSDDATDSLLSMIAKNDDRIKIIENQERKGIAYSRNKGVEVSAGEYIVILDSDDEAYPERIEKQLRFLNDNQEFSGVGSEFSYMDDEGNDIVIVKSPVRNTVSADELLEDPMSLIHGTLMVKRECFGESGGYREEFERAVDYDLMLRMLERSKFANIMEPLVRVRVSLTSGTFRERSVQLKYSKLVQELALERRECGLDLLQKKDREAFRGLKQKIFGKGIRFSWMEISSNYMYWAHRMYHRGPMGYARRLVFASIKYNPMNIKAWGFMLFLFFPEGVKNLLVDIKRTFTK